MSVILLDIRESPPYLQTTSSRPAIRPEEGSAGHEIAMEVSDFGELSRTKNLAHVRLHDHAGEQLELGIVAEGIEVGLAVDEIAEVGVHVERAG